MIPEIPIAGAWDTVLDGPSREALERAALPSFLHAQRWFSGKAREIRAVRVIDWTRLPLDTLAFAVVLEVAYADGDPDLFFVPLAITTRTDAAVVAHLQGPAGEISLSDALTAEAVSSTLLTIIGESQELPTQHGRIRGTATPAYPVIRGDRTQPLAVDIGPATSSNSLVFYGRRLLLKLFRRLQAGIHPDYEVGRFLVERAGFERTPRVAGELEYLPADGEPVTLGILQEMVPNQGDGWEHALGELTGYYERTEEAVGNYLQDAALLGRRTAEMHLALASDPKDPAFAPEPRTTADAEALRDDVLHQGRQALTLLLQTLDRLPTGEARTAGRLLAVGPAALDRIAAAPIVDPTGAKTRVHGDYHLGQVLRTDGDYVILDFEGEPTRTLSERRAKSSPVRDVAGMLRSYHYAAYAGLFAFTLDHPGEFTRLEPRARAWHRQVAKAFLDTYRATAGSAPFLPQRPEEFAALLDLFALGKAFFELNYELNNRPDWVHIPMQGALELIESGNRDR